MADEYWLTAIEYAASRLGEELDPNVRIHVSPEAALELLWDFHDLFWPRLDAIQALPYNTEFDAEADVALIDLAATDTFAKWDELSAGAWRVLLERLVFVQAVAATNATVGTKVFTSAPRGLDRQSLARFVLLVFLLGPGKDVPLRSPDEEPPSLLAGLALPRLRWQ